MRKNRAFTFLSWLALSTALSVLLLNLTPDGLMSAKATAPSQGLAYFPEGIHMVVHIDVHRALNSPLFSRLFSDPHFFRDYSRFMQETGIDPRQDISEALVGGGANQGLLLVRGPLLREKVYAFLGRNQDVKSQYMKTEDYKGYSLLLSSGRSAPSAVFLEEDLLALGDRKMLESGIDTRVGAAPSLLQNNQIVNLLSAIPQSTTFWLVGINPQGNLPPIPPLRALEKTGAKLRSVVMSGNLDVAVSAKVRGFFDDNQTAQQVASVSQGLIALSKLQGGPRPAELQQLLEGVAIESYQNQAILSLQIPYSFIDQMMRKHTVVSQSQ